MAQKMGSVTPSFECIKEIRSNDHKALDKWEYLMIIFLLSHRNHML